MPETAAGTISLLRKQYTNIEEMLLFNNVIFIYFLENIEEIRDFLYVISRIIYYMLVLKMFKKLFINFDIFA